MDFKPKTEKEIAESKLLSRGVYDFEVLNAWEKTAKTSGNPMIELQIRISGAAGSRVIADYLVSTKADKLRSACAACGLLPKYEAGSVSNADFMGKQGRLKLGIEKGKNGYPDRNQVADYILPK